MTTTLHRALAPILAAVITGISSSVVTYVRMHMYCYLEAMLGPVDVLSSVHNSQIIITCTNSTRKDVRGKQ